MFCFISADLKKIPKSFTQNFGFSEIAKINSRKKFDFWQFAKLNSREKSIFFDSRNYIPAKISSLKVMLYTTSSNKHSPFDKYACVTDVLITYWSIQQFLSKPVS